MFKKYRRIIFVSFTALTLAIMLTLIFFGDPIADTINKKETEEHKAEMADMEVDSQLRGNVMSMANAVKDEVQNDMTEQDTRKNDKSINEKRIDNFDYDKNKEMAENDREEKLVTNAYLLKSSYSSGDATVDDVKEIHDIAYGD
ncbi:hypothetical protein GCM10028778_11740 [Barrientosiimonas marina]|uniref:Uncharacterized protein n=1 Tax=Lentibacillus kimchii TaxID=1542911 RepID=A0ABW2UWN2_9BACI